MTGRGYLPESREPDPRLECSIGIMAYNEEANIGRLLEALLRQQLRKVAIREILVVASGCSDRTVDIVKEFARRTPKVRLLCQERREGKASAINLFISQCPTPILVLESADTLPGDTTIEQLVTPLSDPEVGMTGGHPVPVNGEDTFVGFCVNLLWRLHHRIALRRPKMGELIAFRNSFSRIPPDCIVDEPAIEPLLSGQGFSIRYVPEAIAYNKGPDTVADYLKRRRSIFAGYLRLKDTLGYAPATMHGTSIIGPLLRELRLSPKALLWTVGAVCLEVYGRLLGIKDYRSGRRDLHIWEIAETTKQLADVKGQAEPGSLAPR